MSRHQVVNIQLGYGESGTILSAKPSECIAATPSHRKKSSYNMLGLEPKLSVPELFLFTDSIGPWNYPNSDHMKQSTQLTSWSPRDLSNLLLFSFLQRLLPRMGRGFSHTVPHHSYLIHPLRPGESWVSLQRITKC
jgi:hypothetical protein